LEEFDMQYGPCPGMLEKVLPPVLIEKETVLELTSDPFASLKVDGRVVDQWCVDAAVGHSGGPFARKWVLLACPCQQETCISQCCYEGYRLNINK